MKALIIVDIQNDFLPGGALAVPQGDEIISVVNELQAVFPLVVATQDWHPADHGSFASSHPGKKTFDMGTLKGLDQVLWPDHCVQGNEGSKLAKDLETHRVEAIFRKGMNPEIDSYSAFFDNGRRKSTGLSDYLKGKGVEEVFISGLAGDFCVAYTALDALSEGFSTWLVMDATRPIEQDGFETFLDKFTTKGGKIINSVDCLKE